MKNPNKINNGRVFSYLRWSSDRQNWGDSERRQNEMAEQWCARNGLSLAGSEKDSGVSAFKGKNRQEGTGLHRLLKTVSSGDTILIEDTDRFSREKPLDSLNALRDTVNHGVDIVFLRTGVRVTRENFDNPEILFPSFFGSFLANQESAKKSARVKASWQARIVALKEGKPINQNLPSWLRWNGQSVVQIPEKVEIVQRIYRDYIAGSSLRAICRKLVTEGVTSISKRKGSRWRVEYMAEILKNRSVLGDCLHSKPPTPNIFPKIISETDFYAVQKRMKAAKHFTTKVRKADVNLFTGVAVCGCCGGAMNMCTFRRAEQTLAYLYCGPSLHGKTDCRLEGKRYGKGIKYEPLETSFLEIMSRFDALQKAMGEEQQKASKIDELEGRLAVIEAQAEKYLRAFENDASPSNRAMERLKQIEAEEGKLREQLEEERARARAERPASESWERFATMLSTRQQQEPGYRMKLKNVIRSLVDKIEIELGTNRYRIFVRDYYRPIQVHIKAADDFEYHITLPPDSPDAL